MQPDASNDQGTFQPATAWEDHQAGHLAAQTRYLAQVARSTDTIKNILVAFVILTAIAVILVVAQALG